MKIQTKNNGSVLLITVFAIALLTAFVVGMLEMNSEQIQLMRNEIYTAQARAIAEAGLAYAFSQLRTNSAWRGPYTSDFGGGSYTVKATDSPLDINSIGTSPQGFKSKVRADITIGGTAGSYVVRIDKLRINQ